jgi:hypothetical protein
MYLIFVLFERACQDAVQYGVLFLKFLSFKERKGISSFMTKNPREKNYSDIPSHFQPFPAIRNYSQPFAAIRNYSQPFGAIRMAPNEFFPPEKNSLKMGVYLYKCLYM